MTTTTTRSPAPTTARHRASEHEDRGELSFPGMLRGEWIKLLSLRSTWWTAAITVAVMALLAAATASAAGDFAAEAASRGLEAHGAELIVAGFQFGMVTVAVLGALLMTSEYSTGMIRSTFAAIPARLPVLWAKAVAIVGLTLIVSVLSLLAATLAAAPWLAAEDLLPALGEAATWQAFGGMTFFFVAVSLIALAAGAVLRHTAGTITAVLGLLLLLPAVLQFIPIDWVQDLVSLMPLPAAVGFVATSGLLGSNELLTPWQGVAVVGAYALVAVLAAAVSLRRRDV